MKSEMAQLDVDIYGNGQMFIKMKLKSAEAHPRRAYVSFDAKFELWRRTHPQSKGIRGWITEGLEPFLRERGFTEVYISDPDHDYLYAYMGYYSDQGYMARDISHPYKRHSRFSSIRKPRTPWEGLTKETVEQISPLSWRILFTVKQDSLNRDDADFKRFFFCDENGSVIFGVMFRPTGQNSIIFGNFITGTKKPAHEGGIISGESDLWFHYVLEPWLAVLGFEKVYVVLVDAIAKQLFSFLGFVPGQEDGVMVKPLRDVSLAA